jgi:hypothetical protein
MRLRDAVRYALYVSREVGEHRFGASTTVVLRAKFLDLVLKLLHYGYTKQAGHTKKLLELVMSPDPVASEHPTGSGNPTKDERDQKEATSTENVIKLFWNAMRDVGEKDDLRKTIRGILQKLYVQAFREDENAGKRFDAAYETCMAGEKAAVSGRKRTKAKLNVRRVQTGGSALAYVTRDAIELNTVMYVIAQTKARGSSHSLIDGVLDEGTEMGAITSRYLDVLSVAVSDFTVVVSAGHGGGEHEMRVLRCSVSGGKSRKVRTKDVGVLGSNMVEKEGFGDQLRTLLDGDDGDARGLGSVVVFLAVECRGPVQFAKYAESTGAPSVCVFLHDVEQGNRDTLATIVPDAVIIGSSNDASAWVNGVTKPSAKAPRCKTKRPNPSINSSTAVEVRRGNVVIDPFREPQTGITATTKGAKSALANEDVAVFYNHETYSRARTYAPSVVTVSGAVEVPGDGKAEDFGALARCAALEARAVQLIDATALGAEKAKKEPWLGVLVAMACNPRIMLVVSDEQHNIIAAEVEEVAKLPPLPSVGARRSSGTESRERVVSEERLPLLRDGARTAPVHVVPHVDQYEDLIADAAHETCAVAAATQKAQLIVIGHDAIEAARRAYGDGSRSDQSDPVELFNLLLASVEGANDRGSASPILAWCTTHDAVESQRIQVYEYQDDASMNVVSSEYKSEGQESSILGGATHVIFVVDVGRVREWDSAVDFWKSDRGLNAKGARKCAWVTVLLVPNGSEVDPAPASGLVIGEAGLSGNPNVVSYECGSRDLLAPGSVRTYDAGLRVSTAGSTIKLASDEVDADDRKLAKKLIKLLACRSIEATVESRNERLLVRMPITVIDVTGVNVTNTVTKRNVSFLARLGMARNYILVTTREQSTEIGKAAIRRASRMPAAARAAAITKEMALKAEAANEARRVSREAKRQEERRRKLEDADTESDDPDDLDRDVLPYQAQARDESTARSAKRASRKAKKEAGGAERVTPPAERWERFYRKPDKLARAPHELARVRARLLRNRNRNRSPQSIVAKYRRSKEAKLGAASAGQLEALEGVGEAGAANADEAEANGGEPVFAPEPVQILGRTYDVSERGCELDTSRCKLKNAIKAKLQSENPKLPKLRFLLVRLHKGKGVGKIPQHHALGVLDAKRCLYMRCVTNGEVEAEVTTTKDKFSREHVDEADLAREVERADRIFVLCTSP